MQFTVDINYSYREFESASVEVEADSADDITEEAVIAALGSHRGDFEDDAELRLKWAVAQMDAPGPDRDQDVSCTGINCEHCAEHVCKLVVVDGASLIICLEC